MLPKEVDDDAVRCGLLEVSRIGAFARLGDKELALTFAQRRLLAVLVERAGKAFMRADLYAAAFGRALPSGSRAVDQHVSEIRRALGDRRDAILSIDRVGYRLEPRLLG